VSTDGTDHSAKTEVEIDRLSNFDKRLFYIKIDFERAFQKKSLTRLYQTCLDGYGFMAPNIELLYHSAGVVLLKRNMCNL
jgi:hypothetical protein